MKQSLKRFCTGLVVSLMVVFYPAAAFAAANTNETTAPASSQTTGPQSPTGADATTYHLNEATGKWENDYYSWDPATGVTTPKEAPKATFNSDTQTWDTEAWQYNAASQKYEPVPVSSTTTQSNTTQTGLNNTVSSLAQTGSATVTGNTTGGDATSGDASAAVNVINLLQSSFATGSNNNGVVTFMANIPGNVTGNLMVDPGSIAQNQGTTNLQSSQGVMVNNQNDGTINNAIILNASSGNAGVIANTSAGSATSGDTNAVANVINMMNSSVGANQSFIGMINVQGDLSGDILFPVGFLDSVIAANNTATSGSSTQTNTNNQAITNNVSTTATTGDATVQGNSTAGNGTSGSAQTSLTVMNLTGSQIIGNNALMVFVNVGGKWTGLIMNAPGSTTATLGGGISQATNTGQTLESTLNNNTNQAINNDISVAAHSGDAEVSRNTNAGNATSGNASATVNLANVINSQMSLSGWFGILFINVLGNWMGSFGSSQAATTPPPTGSNTPSTGSQNPVFSFTSNQTAHQNGATNQATTNVAVNNTQTEPSNANNTSAVLGDTTPSDTPSGPTESSAALDFGNFNFALPLLGLLLGAAIIGSSRLISVFRHA